MNDLGACQCCGKEDDPAVGVAGSGLGALSIAWGRKCLAAGVEPYWLVVFTAGSCGGYEHTAVWFKHLANRTLLYFGKSWAEFFSDIREDMFRELKDMENEDHRLAH